MSNDLQCASWVITLPEPPGRDHPARIKVQEDYLGAHIAAWLLDSPPAWLPGLHSFHFMRYIDAAPPQPHGMTIELRLLGSTEALNAASSDVEARLTAQKRGGTIHDYQTKPVNRWAAGADYGGPEVSVLFAQLLAASSHLALRLLRHPRHDFAAREAIVRNWLHCLSLITRGG